MSRSTVLILPPHLIFPAKDIKITETNEGNRNILNRLNKRSGAVFTTLQIPRNL
jgi:hypothetical protein